MNQLISLYFYKAEDFCAFAESGKSADVIYVPVLPFLRGAEDKLTAAVQLLKKTQSKSGKAPMIVIALPYIMRGKTLALLKKNFDMLCDVADGFLLQNIGDFDIVKNLASQRTVKLFGDYSLNVTNSATAEYLGKQDGLFSAAILPELTREEQLMLAREFPENLIPEICMDDNVIVMRSEHCFAAEKEGYHCGRCGLYGTSAPPLCDIHGNVYPLICNPIDCNSILLAPRKGQNISKDSNAVPDDFKTCDRTLMLRYSVIM